MEERSGHPRTRRTCASWTFSLERDAGCGVWEGGREWNGRADHLEVTDDELVVQNVRTLSFISTDYFSIGRGVVCMATLGHSRHFLCSRLVSSPCPGGALDTTHDVCGRLARTWAGIWEPAAASRAPCSRYSIFIRPLSPSGYPTLDGNRSVSYEADSRMLTAALEASEIYTGHWPS